MLPAERTWTVRFLGLDAEPARLQGPPGEPLRAEAGADPQPRTPDRAGALFTLLGTAQCGPPGQGDAPGTRSSSALSPEAKLAELHAQALPRELIGALSELLTARG